MQEIFKAAFVICGVAITMYVTQKEQTFHIEALQKSFDVRASELEKIRRDINEIQVNLARVSARDCQGNYHWDQSLLEQ